MKSRSIAHIVPHLIIKKYYDRNASAPETPSYMICSKKQWVIQHHFRPWIFFPWTQTTSAVVVVVVVVAVVVVVIVVVIVVVVVVVDDGDCIAYNAVAMEICRLIPLMLMFHLGNVPKYRCYFFFMFVSFSYIGGK